MIKSQVSDVIKQSRMRSRGAKLANGNSAGKVATASSDRALKARRELTLFLKEFIDNNFGSLN